MYRFMQTAIDEISVMGAADNRAQMQSREVFIPSGEHVRRWWRCLNYSNLNSLLVSKEIKVYELSPAQETLEEAFLRLTKTGTVPPNV
jgi:hypothetical protein